MNSINGIFDALAAMQDEDGDKLFNVELRTEGEQPTIRVTDGVLGEDSLPVYVITDENQTRCISYLFNYDEVKEEMREEFMKHSLGFTVIAPLTSVGMIGDQFVMVGSMSVNTDVDELAAEIDVQMSNVDYLLSESRKFLNTTV